MSHAVQAKPADIIKALNPFPGYVLHKGRCTQVRKAGNSMLHLVVLPAADEYSSPSTVEILAAARLAQVGDDCQILCRAAGFRRQYQQTDADTGEKKTVTTADNKFFAVTE